MESEVLNADKQRGKYRKLLLLLLLLLLIVSVENLGNCNLIEISAPIVRRSCRRIDETKPSRNVQAKIKNKIKKKLKSNQTKLVTALFFLSRPQILYM